MTMIIDLAKIHRGKKVESIHYGIACHVNTDQVIKSWGDSQFACYTRSLVKAVQAKIAAKYNPLEAEFLALASSSHLAEDKHIHLIEKFASKFQLSEQMLQCGEQSNSRGELQSPIYHNCSGKHYALLAACKAKNWTTANYMEAQHPLQQEIAAELQQLLAKTESIAYATDGCGLPTFYLRLEEIAFIFARIAKHPDYQSLIQAVNQYPFIIGGSKQIDSLLMNAYPNKFLAKVGAEGLIAVANLELSEAIIIKIIDGSVRARAHALVSLLEYLEWITKDSIELDSNIYNSPKDIVGEIVPRKDWGN